MALDGAWNIKIDSDDIDPEIVPRDAKLVIKAQGSELSGSMEGPYPMGEGVVIDHGVLDGDHVRWTATVNDREMTGEVEVGIFGSATFVATRA
jgi:hypothetical protein